MKRTLILLWSLVSALFIAGCNDGPGEYGNLYVNPTVDAVAEGATAEIDQDSKEINLIYDASRDFSNISIELTLEPGVRMVSPATNPFTLDLSDGEYKEVTVFSLDRNITYNIKASVLIDISEPILSMTATAGGYSAIVDIRHESRTIDVHFEYNIAISEVTVDYELAAGVTVAAPEGKIWDLTEPVKLQLRKNEMSADYTVTGRTGIDDSMPFSGFTARSLGSEADVTVDHEARTLEISFDGGNIDVTRIEVDYLLDEGFEVISPKGNVWDLSDIENDSGYFILAKNGFILTYEIIFDMDANFDDAVVSFEASVGGRKAMVIVNNEEKWISIAYEDAVALGAVEISLVLADGITAVSPSGTVWDLSQASHEVPVSLVLEKYGVQEEYGIYASSGLFVPPFYKGMSTPEHWTRYIKGIPPSMCVYLITELAGNPVVAYAVAIQSEHAEFKTIGEGYSSRKTLTELAAGVPDATVVINGTDDNNLLMVDGNVIDNVSGEGNLSLLSDKNGKTYVFAATNRLNADGRPAANDNVAGAYYSNEIWWWDTKEHYPDIVSVGGVGAGYLNMNAHNSGNGAFPEGIYAAADPNGPKIARATFGGSENRDVMMFFVCEASERSTGCTEPVALEVIRDMGAWSGGRGPIADPSLIGAIINGQQLIEPSGGTEGVMSFAYSIKPR